ncbi:MAG TPA: PIG-L family deacetylase [Candidatus Dormibacteraeota bacterium]|nr:PIG-L family deacetylase [Candidatus Dormibacteraeota bacterium]
MNLLAVHAHPDDEAVSTGGVLHKYAKEGVRTILVTCTGGELGDGPGGLKPDQPDHDPEAVRQWRAGELEVSRRALHISEIELLGYHDSGMADWNQADAPGAFAAVDLAEEVAKLSQIMEKYRPQVVITYAEDGGYGHPDHIRANAVTRGAVLATGIPQKLYYTVFPKSLAQRVITQMKELGIDPWDLGQLDFDPDNPPFGVADDQVTTVIDVTEDVPAKLASVRAHASQMDNAFFAHLPDQVAPLILGQEYYIRAIDLTGEPVPEVDLFAGIR